MSAPIPRWSLRRARLLVGSKLALVAGLVLFVALAWIVEQMIGIDGPVKLAPPVALLLAGVPASLWLAFFYLQDRHEPEPMHFVAGVFLLGMLVAAPMADFLVYQLAPPVPLGQHGLRPFALDRVIHAVLVIGLAQELCKYAAVRYTIYTAPEFDEPMDGVVYMMSVGTGFAVWINYHRLQGLGGTVFLSVGAAQAVVTTLAHASFAGWLGYVLGRAKFTRRRPVARGVLLFTGLLGAAALNGQFALVEEWVTTRGLGSEPWKGVLYAAALAIGVFALLMLLAQRLLADSPHRPRRMDGVKGVGP
ncbi:MAG TPA: PrsW family glutamic-type intramembrane protease [Kofleriaceae bacterium]|nr:PrsW family glutamic-type intramembrane protease [Kofleriaceae bacterium]